MEAVRASKFRLIVPVCAEDGRTGVVICSVRTSGTVSLPGGPAVIAARVEACLFRVPFTGDMACEKQRRIKGETRLQMVDR